MTDSHSGYSYVLYLAAVEAAERANAIEQCSQGCGISMTHACDYLVGREEQLLNHAHRCIASCGWCQCASRLQVSNTLPEVTKDCWVLCRAQLRLGSMCLCPCVWAGGWAVDQSVEISQITDPTDLRPSSLKFTNSKRWLISPEMVWICVPVTLCGVWSKERTTR